MAGRRFPVTTADCARPGFGQALLGNDPANSGAKKDDAELLGEAPAYLSSRVFVANVPVDFVHRLQLHARFSKYGIVTEVIIHRKGFAFVQFKKPEEALAAIKGESGSYLEGNKIYCELTKHENKGGPSRSAYPPKEIVIGIKGDGDNQAIPKGGQRFPQAVGPKGDPGQDAGRSWPSGGTEEVGGGGDATKFPDEITPALETEQDWDTETQVSPLPPPSPPPPPPLVKQQDHSLTLGLFIKKQKPSAKNKLVPFKKTVAKKDEIAKSFSEEDTLVPKATQLSSNSFSGFKFSNGLAVSPPPEKGPFEELWGCDFQDELGVNTTAPNQAETIDLQESCEDQEEVWEDDAPSQPLPSSPSPRPHGGEVNQTSVSSKSPAQVEVPVSFLQDSQLHDSEEPSWDDDNEPDFIPQRLFSAKKQELNIVEVPVEMLQSSNANPLLQSNKSAISPSISNDIQDKESWDEEVDVIGTPDHSSLVTPNPLIQDKDKNDRSCDNQAHSTKDTSHPLVSSHRGNQVFPAESLGQDNFADGHSRIEHSGQAEQSVQVAHVKSVAPELHTSEDDRQLHTQPGKVPQERQDVNATDTGRQHSTSTRSDTNQKKQVADCHQQDGSKTQIQSSQLPDSNRSTSQMKTSHEDTSRASNSMSNSGNSHMVPLFGSFVQMPLTAVNQLGMPANQVHPRFGPPEPAVATNYMMPLAPPPPHSGQGLLGNAPPQAGPPPMPPPSPGPPPPRVFPVGSVPPVMPSRASQNLTYGSLYPSRPVSGTVGGYMAYHASMGGQPMYQQGRPVPPRRDTSLVPLSQPTSSTPVGGHPAYQQGRPVPLNQPKSSAQVGGHSIYQQSRSVQPSPPTSSEQVSPGGQVLPVNSGGEEQRQRQLSGQNPQPAYNSVYMQRTASSSYSTPSSSASGPNEQRDRHLSGQSTLSHGFTPPAALPGIPNQQGQPLAMNEHRPPPAHEMQSQQGHSVAAVNRRQPPAPVMLNQQRQPITMNGQSPHMPVSASGSRPPTPTYGYQQRQTSNPLSNAYLSPSHPYGSSMKNLTMSASVPLEQQIGFKDSSFPLTDIEKSKINSEFKRALEAAEGPLEVTDNTLLRIFMVLPEPIRRGIKRTGGLKAYLQQSEAFEVKGDMVSLPGQMKSDIKMEPPPGGYRPRQPSGLSGSAPEFIPGELSPLRRSSSSGRLQSEGTAADIQKASCLTRSRHESVPDTGKQSSAIVRLRHASVPDSVKAADPGPDDPYDPHDPYDSYYPQADSQKLAMDAEESGDGGTVYKLIKDAPVADDLWELDSFLTEAYGGGYYKDYLALSKELEKKTNQEADKTIGQGTSKNEPQLQGSKAEEQQCTQKTSSGENTNASTLTMAKSSSSVDQLKTKESFPTGRIKVDVSQKAQQGTCDSSKTIHPSVETKADAGQKERRGPSDSSKTNKSLSKCGTKDDIGQKVQQHVPTNTGNTKESAGESGTKVDAGHRAKDGPTVAGKTKKSSDKGEGPTDSSKTEEQIATRPAEGPAACVTENKCMAQVIDSKKFERRAATTFAAKLLEAASKHSEYTSERTDGTTTSRQEQSDSDRSLVKASEKGSAKKSDQKIKEASESDKVVVDDPKDGSSDVNKEEEKGEGFESSASWSTVSDESDESPQCYTKRDIVDQFLVYEVKEFLHAVSDTFHSMSPKKKSTKSMKRKHSVAQDAPARSETSPDIPTSNYSSDTAIGKTTRSKVRCAAVFDAPHDGTSEQNFDSCDDASTNAPSEEVQDTKASLVKSQGNGTAVDAQREKVLDIEEVSADCKHGATGPHTDARIDKLPTIGESLTDSQDGVTLSGMNDQEMLDTEEHIGNSQDDADVEKEKEPDCKLSVMEEKDEAEYTLVGDAVSKEGGIAISETGVKNQLDVAPSDTTQEPIRKLSNIGESLTGIQDDVTLSSTDNQEVPDTEQHIDDSQDDVAVETEEKPDLKESVTEEKDEAECTPVGNAVSKEGGIPTSETGAENQPDLAPSDTTLEPITKLPNIGETDSKDGVTLSGTDDQEVLDTEQHIGDSQDDADVGTEEKPDCKESVTEEKDEDESTPGGDAVSKEGGIATSETVVENQLDLASSDLTREPLTTAAADFVENPQCNSSVKSIHEVPQGRDDCGDKHAHVLPDKSSEVEENSKDKPIEHPVQEELVVQSHVPVTSMGNYLRDAIADELGDTSPSYHLKTSHKNSNMASIAVNTDVIRTVHKGIVTSKVGKISRVTNTTAVATVTRCVGTFEDFEESYRLKNIELENKIRLMEESLEHERDQSTLQKHSFQVEIRALKDSLESLMFKKNEIEDQLKIKKRQQVVEMRKTTAELRDTDARYSAQRAKVQSLEKENACITKELSAITRELFELQAVVEADEMRRRRLSVDEATSTEDLEEAERKSKDAKEARTRALLERAQVAELRVLKMQLESCQQAIYKIQQESQYTYSVFVNSPQISAYEKLYVNTQWTSYQSQVQAAIQQLLTDYERNEALLKKGTALADLSKLQVPHLEAFTPRTAVPSSTSRENPSPLLGFTAQGSTDAATHVAKETNSTSGEVTAPTSTKTISDAGLDELKSMTSRLLQPDLDVNKPTPSMPTLAGSTPLFSLGSLYGQQQSSSTRHPYNRESREARLRSIQRRLGVNPDTGKPLPSRGHTMAASLGLEEAGADHTSSTQASSSTQLASGNAASFALKQKTLASTYRKHLPSSSSDDDRATSPIFTMQHPVATMGMPSVDSKHPSSAGMPSRAKSVRSPTESPYSQQEMNANPPECAKLSVSNVDKAGKANLSQLSQAEGSQLRLAEMKDTAQATTSHKETMRDLQESARNSRDESGPFPKLTSTHQPGLSSGSTLPTESQPRFSADQDCTDQNYQQQQQQQQQQPFLTEQQRKLSSVSQTSKQWERELTTHEDKSVSTSKDQKQPGESISNQARESVNESVSPVKTVQGDSYVAETVDDSSKMQASKAAASSNIPSSMNQFPKWDAIKAARSTSPSDEIEESWGNLPSQLKARLGPRLTRSGGVTIKPLGKSQEAVKPSPSGPKFAWDVSQETKTKGSSKRKGSEEKEAGAAMIGAASGLSPIDDVEGDGWTTVIGKKKRKAIDIVEQQQQTPKSKPAGGGSLDKIHSALARQFPGITRKEVMDTMKQVRIDHRGSLSGVSMAVIVKEASSHIKNTNAKYMVSKSSHKETSKLYGCEGFCKLHEECDDICVICQDDLRALPGGSSRGGSGNSNTKVRMLDCGHMFHEDCIKLWYHSRERTCPICRCHTLLPEDFPALTSDDFPPLTPD